MAEKVSDRVIGRLCLYRRILLELAAAGDKNLYSHELAGRAGVTAAQLRRDLMVIGYLGSPSRGYDIKALTESVAAFFEDPEGDNAALVGVGNLGRAILSYFGGRRLRLNIVAGFDSDPRKVDRVIHNCRCYPMEKLCEIINENSISVGVITVPAVDAQAIADTMAEAGVTGIMNFAPVSLKVNRNIYLENIDLALSLEKVAYFARQNQQK